MNTSYGIVLGSPRSGTTYLMSVLNTIPDLESISGTLLPVAIPHVVNQDLDDAVYDALTVGFERAHDAGLSSSPVGYHSRAAAMQKWFRALPNGLRFVNHALSAANPRASAPAPTMDLRYKDPALALCPEFVLRRAPGLRRSILHIYRDVTTTVPTRSSDLRYPHSRMISYHSITASTRVRKCGSGAPTTSATCPWWVEEGSLTKFSTRLLSMFLPVWMWTCLGAYHRTTS